MVDKPINQGGTGWSQEFQNQLNQIYAEKQAREAASKQIAIPTIQYSSPTATAPAQKPVSQPIYVPLPNQQPDFRNIPTPTPSGGYGGSSGGSGGSSQPSPEPQKLVLDTSKLPYDSSKGVFQALIPEKNILYEKPKPEPSIIEKRVIQLTGGGEASGRIPTRIEIPTSIPFSGIGGSTPSITKDYERKEEYLKQKLGSEEFRTKKEKAEKAQAELELIRRQQEEQTFAETQRIRRINELKFEQFAKEDELKQLEAGYKKQLEATGYSETEQIERNKKIQEFNREYASFENKLQPYIVSKDALTGSVMVSENVPQDLVEESERLGKEFELTVKPIVEKSSNVSAKAEEVNLRFFGESGAYALKEKEIEQAYGKIGKEIEDFNKFSSSDLTHLKPTNILTQKGKTNFLTGTNDFSMESRVSKAEKNIEAYNLEVDTTNLEGKILKEQYPFYRATALEEAEKKQFAYPELTVEGVSSVIKSGIVGGAVSAPFGIPGGPPGVASTAVGGFVFGVGERYATPFAYQSIPKGYKAKIPFSIESPVSKSMRNYLTTPELSVKLKEVEKQSEATKETDWFYTEKEKGVTSLILKRPALAKIGGTGISMLGTYGLAKLASPLTKKAVSGITGAVEKRLSVVDYQFKPTSEAVSKGKPAILTHFETGYGETGESVMGIGVAKGTIVKTVTPRTDLKLWEKIVFKPKTTVTETPELEVPFFVKATPKPLEPNIGKTGITKVEEFESANKGFLMDAKGNISLQPTSAMELKRTRFEKIPKETLTNYDVFALGEFRTPKNRIIFASEGTVSPQANMARQVEEISTKGKLVQKREISSTMGTYKEKTLIGKELEKAMQKQSTIPQEGAGLYASKTKTLELLGEDNKSVIVGYGKIKSIGVIGKEGKAKAIVKMGGKTPEEEIINRFIVTEKKPVFKILENKERLEKFSPAEQKIAEEDLKAISKSIVEKQKIESKKPLETILKENEEELRKKALREGKQFIMFSEKSSAKMGLEQAVVEKTKERIKKTTELAGNLPIEEILKKEQEAMGIASQDYQNKGYGISVGKAIKVAGVTQLLKKKKPIESYETIEYELPKTISIQQTQLSQKIGQQVKTTPMLIQETKSIQIQKTKQPTPNQYLQQFGIIKPTTKIGESTKQIGITTPQFGITITKPKPSETLISKQTIGIIPKTIIGQKQKSLSIQKIGLKQIPRMEIPTMPKPTTPKIPIYGGFFLPKLGSLKRTPKLSTMENEYYVKKGKKKKFLFPWKVSPVEEALGYKPIKATKGEITKYLKRIRTKGYGLGALSVPVKKKR